MAVRRRSREFWEGLVAEADAEGSSVARTAQRHRVRPATLKWWKWHLGAMRRARSTRPSKPTRLLPVVFSAGDVATAAPQFVTIELAASVTVRVPIGSDVGYVAALIAAVRRTC